MGSPDCTLSKESINNAGLYLIPKLKYEHISLTSYSKTRAAQVSAKVFYQHLCNSMYIQVLSESVTNGLR